MRGTVGLKGQHWMERPHELMPPDFDIRGVLLGQLGNLRCIIVNLELSIDPEDEPNAGRDDASPGIKMLFRHCATAYTTVFERIHESSSSLGDKLAFGHIEGPRNEFIRWGREAGILREDEDTGEYRYEAGEDIKLTSPTTKTVIPKNRPEPTSSEMFGQLGAVNKKLEDWIDANLTPMTINGSPNQVPPEVLKPPRMEQMRVSPWIILGQMRRIRRADRTIHWIVIGGRHAIE
ncbi:hypothetical protein J4E80_003368 [Alternaria sp. BMP 0032]|nr:hypothetical protein J4E80_003368 [Alternaria sp. BMP 0032]